MRSEKVTARRWCGAAGGLSCQTTLSPNPVNRALRWQHEAVKSLSILAKSVSYRQHAGTGSSRLGPVCHRTIDVRDGEVPLGPTPSFPPPRASAGLFPSVSSSPGQEASTPRCSVFPVSLGLSYAGPLPPSYSLFSRLSGPFCVSRLGWFC